MKNTTWVFGSMIAAGAVLLAVPQVFAQGGAPQMPGRPAGMGAGAPAGFGGGAPGGFGPGMGGAPAGFGGGAPGAGRANGAAAAQNGTKQNSTSATKSNTATRTTAQKSEKALAEAAKYQLSNHRIDLVKSTVDGYASSEDLGDSTIVHSIMNEISEQMPLVPAVPLEKVDLKALNDEATRIVEQEYGSDDKNLSAVVEAEAEAEFPLYKVGDKVNVNYNMGPKRFSVNGILYRVTENAITVEDKVINLVDLSDEVRSRFDPRKNQYMRERYKETHEHLIRRLKIEKIQDCYDKLKADIFKRNESAGYIYDVQTDHWGTAQEVAKNYIDRLLREKAKQAQSSTRPKPARTDVKPSDTTDDIEVIDDDGGDTIAEVKPAGGEKTLPVVAVNDAIKIENNAQSHAKYEEVVAKAEEQKKDANDNFAGIDADCGYKNACWGFTIADTRYALWREPEFAYIRPALGRDTIDFSLGDDIDIGLPICPNSIDLIYVSNGLSKVVYMMGDCSRQDFLQFKDALTEQYGHAAEDKGSAFTNIFNGKTKPQQIAGSGEAEKAQEEVKEAERVFNEAQAELKNATDDDRDELQTKRDEAAEALKAAVAKADSLENTVSEDSLPYVFSRIKLATDATGSTILPYTFSWKGQNVTGTLIFYYDKGKDKVTSLVFAKEYKK
ncbi:MAG: hypothetical protein PUC15_10435 [Lentisphaeria bacterium]|nr:hypothetical protein [Lentisphaeria bacterium]